MNVTVCAICDDTIVQIENMVCVIGCAYFHLRITDIIIKTHTIQHTEVNLLLHFLGNDSSFKLLIEFHICTCNCYH